MGWISPGGVSYRAPYGTKKYFIGNQNIDTWVLHYYSLEHFCVNKFQGWIWTKYILVSSWSTYTLVYLVWPFSVLCSHFVGTFACQIHEMAENTGNVKMQKNQIMVIFKHWHIFSVTLNGNSGENITLFTDIFDSVLVLTHVIRCSIQH